MKFFDTETIGFHGPIVLIQYAEDDGDILLHNAWYEPLYKTQHILSSLCKGAICGFNLTFDWFHVCQMFTTLQLLERKFNDKIVPIEYIQDYAICEADARLGPCLKPENPLDLFANVCSGELQSLMDRDDIRIKRVPTVLAQPLADRLTADVPIPDIYFAARKDKTRWKVMDIKDDMGDVDPDFKDLVLGFDPSRKLKALATELLGFKEDSVLLFDSVSVKCPKVEEMGYAPFAMAHATKTPNGQYIWNKSWPDYIKIHADHWQYNKLARQYGGDDVKYTRALYHYLKEPEPGDTDSVLSCMVGACRWRGFALDTEQLNKLRTKAQLVIGNSKEEFGSPEVCKKYLKDAMEPIERLALSVNGKETTGKIVLENIAAWRVTDLCTVCDGLGTSLEGETCAACNGKGTKDTDELHPAAIRAREIMDYRRAVKSVDLYTKLIKAGRFHASFKVVGTRSSRMAGADSLNAQGIEHAKETRRCFPLADFGLLLSGGDFSSFEMTIQDAAYFDSKMHEEIKASMQGGFKLHAAWGHRYFFPHMTYEEIIASDDSAQNPMDNFYTRSKQGVFAVCYFGEAFTLVSRVGLPPEQAERAYAMIMADYKEFSESRKVQAGKLVSMSQPDGIGTKVFWEDPAEYVESLLGFRRYFTLENAICKALFKLAENVPEEWTKFKMKVMRRDRQQTASGATRSALLGAAFGIQGANMRAGGNHIIQSTGAQITKRLQQKLWEFQPAGVCDWKILLLNIHDEIMSPMLPELRPQAAKVVKDFVESYRQLIPLIAMEWQEELKSWADK